MSQMSAATFKVLRARRKETTNAINHIDLLRALMRRADRECEQLRMACRANDKLNERVQSLNAELDRLCNMVLPSERETGRDRRQEYPDGERQATQRQSDDVCGMEHEVRATVTRDELEQRSHGYSNGAGPRPRTIQSEVWSNY